MSLDKKALQKLLGVFFWCAACCWQLQREMSSGLFIPSSCCMLFLSTTP